MKNSYNEDYFERGVELGISGYSNFRWIPELTIPMCARMVEILGIEDHDTILDFGCAKGYVVKAFRLLHKRAWGVDISEYAVGQADGDIKQYLTAGPFEPAPEEQYTWIIAKDVFEHISYEALPALLKTLRGHCESIFCIVPLAENGKYVVPWYEQDTTHIIREDLHWWWDRLVEAGFSVTSAEYNMPYIKSNYAKWDKGNGFFIGS